MVVFIVKKRVIVSNPWQELKDTIFRVTLAYHAPISQERLLTQICKGSAWRASVALPSQEALWPNDFELYSHLQPHSLACSGQW